MTPEYDGKSLWCLLVAQTQVVLNDNAAKLMLILLAGVPGVLPEGYVEPVIGGLAMLLILPFISFSPISGWLADRFSKRSVIHATLVMQVVVMVALALSLFARSMPGAIACFFLLALQSAVLSPAKRGILKELAGSSRLSMAVGWMEMLTVTAILVGSLGGGLMFDLFSRYAGNPWSGAVWVAILLSFASLLALGIFEGVKETPAGMSERYEHRIWWRHLGYLADLWRSRPLFRAGLGGTYFFTLGGIVYLTLVQVGREAYDGGAGSGSLTALMLGLLGVGTIAGHLTAGLVSRRRIELGLVPIGCIGMAGGLAFLAAAPLATPLFYAALVVLGFSGGLFLVPIYAFLQDRAGDDRRGRILAAVNVIESIGGVAAATVYVGMARWLGLSPSQQFLFLLMPTMLVGLYLIRLLPGHLVETVARCATYPFSRRPEFPVNEGQPKDITARSPRNPSLPPGEPEEKAGQLAVQYLRKNAPCAGSRRLNEKAIACNVETPV